MADEKKKAKTVDMSRVYAAIGSRPEQVFQLRELRPLLEQQRTAGNLNTPRTFTLERLSNAIEQARTAASPVQVRQQRYQTTEHLGNLVNEINRMLQPLTEAQKGAAQTAFNQNMQKLSNQWAARGLLSSGAAAAQQRQAVENLASQMAAIEAQQQATAIPLAFQYADLGLREDAQRFAQEESNRNFLAQMAQNYVNNLLAGMSQEEAQRQFQQTFEQNRAQAAVENMLRALGFQEEQLQNYIRNILAATQMEIGQNQWAQEFNRQLDLDDFNRQVTIAQLTGMYNGQPTLEYMQLTGRVPLPQNVQQLINTVLDAKRINETPGTDAQTRQQMRQAADQARQQLAMLGFDPSLIGSNVPLANAMSNISQYAMTLPAQNQNFNQRLAIGELLGTYNGQPTLSAQQLALNALQNFASMTPYLPQGMGNVVRNLPALNSLSSFLNQLGGQPTQSTFNQLLQDALSRWTTQQELAFNRERLQAETQLERLRLAQQADYQNWLKERGIKEEEARKTTNNYIIGALSQPTLTQAWNFLIENVEDIETDGADVNAIIDAIERKFGLQARMQSAGSSGTIDFSGLLGGNPRQP